MAKAKGSSPAVSARTSAAPDEVRASADQAERDRAESRSLATAPPPADLRTQDGGRGAGPKSALKGGLGSAGEGATADDAGPRKLQYSVQLHTDEKGLEVVEPVDAETGDEAAKKVLEKCNYKGASIRGVDVYSAPDPNSLGGEREAANMIKNAVNPGAIINTLGTEANAEMTEKLGKADIKELGQ